MVLLLTGILGAGLLGCAGELPPGTPAQDAGRDLVLRFDRAPLWLDQGAPLADTAPKQDGGTPAADTGTPQNDSGPTGVGTPCTGDCDNGLLCILNACRRPCNQPPTDPCASISDCAATERCLPTSQTGIWACMPGTTLGAACNDTIYCPNRSVCASVNDGPHICLPLCTVVGAACGTGGTCLDGGNACLLCSKP